VVALKRQAARTAQAQRTRSRNAVVALKLAAQAVARTWPQHAWKQERRGGIETLVPGPRGHPLRSGSRNAVVALKRDGRATGGRPGQPEAGTPWWH